MYIRFYPASGRARCKACGEIISKGMLQMNVSDGVMKIAANFHGEFEECPIIKERFEAGLKELENPNYRSRKDAEKSC